MQKGFTGILVLVMLVMLLLIGGALYLKVSVDKKVTVDKTQNNPQAITSRELPKKVQQSDDNVLIQQAITAKYLQDNQISNSESSHIQVQSSITKKITTPDGEFASGDVSEAGGAGGGVFIAVKTGNSWKVLFIGNGIADCKDFAGYKIPVEIMDKCTDSSGELVPVNP